MKTSQHSKRVGAVGSYKVQEVKGWLGTGGQLGVQGGAAPAGKKIKSP